jgi:hypothetical protein
MYIFMLTFNNVNVVTSSIDRAAKLKAGPLFIGQRSKRPAPTAGVQPENPRSQLDFLQPPLVIGLQITYRRIDPPLNFYPSRESNPMKIKLLLRELNRHGQFSAGFPDVTRRNEP